MINFQKLDIRRLSIVNMIELSNKTIIADKVVRAALGQLRIVSLNVPVEGNSVFCEKLITEK
jgi:hypothetical protein